MPKFIVSVRNAPEAKIAEANGADILDLKEPAHGALGQPEREALLATARAVPASASMSVACGELVEGARFPSLGSVSARFQFAKAGCASIGTRQLWLKAFREFQSQLPAHITGIPAAYADFRLAQAPEPQQILTAAAELGAKGFLLDTFSKRGGCLFDVMSQDSLVRLMEQARLLGLWVALAGSITLNDLVRTVLLQPRYVAMRGAVCRHDRESEIDAHKVRAISRQLKSPTLTSTTQPSSSSLPAP